MTKKRVLTAPQTAKYLNVSVDTLRIWRKKGTLKGWQTPGGHWRYNMKDIETFRNAQSSKPGTRYIDLDPKKVEVLAALQCTYDEIASGLGISTPTLDRRRKENPAIEEAIKRGRELGKRSIRRLQYELAKEKDRTMLIWLGKQWLGQRDKHDIESTDEIEIIVKYEDDSSTKETI